jgi:hypothetical protein
MRAIANHQAAGNTSKPLYQALVYSSPYIAHKNVLLLHRTTSRTHLPRRPTTTLASLPPRSRTSVRIHPLCPSSRNRWVLELERLVRSSSQRDGHPSHDQNHHSANSRPRLRRREETAGSRPLASPRAQSAPHQGLLVQPLLGRLVCKNHGPRGRSDHIRGITHELANMTQ